MSLGKKDIVKGIKSKAQISKTTSQELLDKFIDIVIKKSKNFNVKISNFGTFYIHKSPKRIGRNPKTGEEFLIGKRSKLSLKASNSSKKLLN